MYLYGVRKLWHHWFLVHSIKRGVKIRWFFVHNQRCVSLGSSVILNLYDETVFSVATVKISTTYPRLSLGSLWKNIMREPLEHPSNYPTRVLW